MIKFFLGFISVCAFLAFAIAQLIAGFVGIEHGLGVFWAWVAVIFAFVFRFTPPITIGAFFGAINVWHWHWAAAAMFAAPGLLFIIPNFISSVFALIKRQ